MEYENFSFVEAVKFLADRAGIELPEMEYSKEAKEKADLKSTILEMNKLAAKYFYVQLKSERGSQAYSYLKNRELSDETITAFGLGFSNKYSDDLYKYLREKGYSEDLIRQAGLINTDERQGVYDKFWNRVMFPIMDVNNRVIGFGGRVMGDGKPKYLNSPETVVFDKSRNLYGLNRARTSKKAILSSLRRIYGCDLSPSVRIYECGSFIGDCIDSRACSSDQALCPGSLSDL